MYHFKLLLNSEVQLTESATLGRFECVSTAIRWRFLINNGSCGFWICDNRRRLPESVRFSCFFFVFKIPASQSTRHFMLLIFHFQLFRFFGFLPFVAAVVVIIFVISVIYRRTHGSAAKIKAHAPNTHTQIHMSQTEFRNCTQPVAWMFPSELKIFLHY